MNKPETVFATIARAIRQLEHGHHADPFGCFCGSDIVDRGEVLRAVKHVERELRAPRRKARVTR